MLHIPYHISRSFIAANRQLRFVYGFDVVEKGCLGLPWCFHGEINAYPIPTMYKFCPSGHVLFTDGRIEEWKGYIDKAMIPLEFEGDTRPIIVPLKIGRGCSRLFEIGPMTYEYLMTKLYAVKYKDIVWL